MPRGLYVHRTSGGRYYLRVGATKPDLTPPQLPRLFQQRGREYVFDEQPVLAATVDHVNRNKRLMILDDSNVDRPILAGLLTFGTEPSEFLLSGAIDAARYGG